MMLSRPRLARSAALVLALSLSACVTPVRPPLEINLVALNDFHGNLDTSKYRFTSSGASGPQTVQAGGIDTVAAALQAWRKEDKELLFVAAGDLVGASPAMSSMWADEPTIEAMNLMGLRASSVGNHEFDQGPVELLRQQNGGCTSPRPEKACKLAPSFGGAKYSYLAANVFDKASGKPLLPAYQIEEVRGVKVGLVGAVLKDTASVALSASIAGLSFVDEADAINQAIPEMRARGATVFVVLIHEGGHTNEPFDRAGCSHLQGGIVDIVKRIDPAVRLVITGHSHTGYLCNVDGRVVTQADMGGHLLSRINLKLDPASHAVTDIAVRNVVMQPGAYPADARVSAYLAGVKERSRAALARPVARLGSRNISRRQSASGESQLGGVIADAVVAATRARGVQIGFMNPGGIRKDLEAGEDLSASYGQAQAVLPFGNTLVVMDMTGDQIRALLEQQWARPNASEESVLQVSSGFSYRWNQALPKGQRIVPGSVRLDGAPLDDAKTYRVVANNFLAEGGDNFPEFAKAANKADTHIRDLDALIEYLARNEHAGAPVGARAGSARIEQAR